MPAVTIDAPRAYEANPGAIRGHVTPAVTQVLIYARRGTTTTFLAARPTPDGTFRVAPTGLRSGDQAIVVVAYRGATRVGTSRVAPVYGLPRTAFQARTAHRVSATVQRALTRIAGPGVTAVWARGMAGGAAASYNAGARFSGASTLKLAILMTALARWRTDPPSTAVWPALQRMIVDSDNDAANEVEVALGGSTSGGSALVNAFCRAMHCRATDMFGGYETTPGSVRTVAGATIPPVSVVRQPVLPRGKYTTAHDLGVLLAGLLEAAGGRGRASRLGISQREARVAIWLLLHARYTGVVRPATSAPVGHKAGWLAGVEHDAALVFAPRGTVVVVIMSQGSGVGPGSTGAYARRIMRVILRHLP